MPFYATEAEAVQQAEDRNARLTEGQRRRTPYRVYAMGVGGSVRGYAVAQTPQSALASCYDELGVSVQLVGRVRGVISKLTPAEIEEVRRLLSDNPLGGNP